LIPNKLMKRSPNFVDKHYFSPELSISVLNTDGKIGPISVTNMALHKNIGHFHNFSKQHLIPAKFYIYNVSFIGNKNVKFQLTLLRQKIVSGFLKLTLNVKCLIIVLTKILTTVCLNLAVSMACWEILLLTFQLKFFPLF